MRYAPIVSLVSFGSLLYHHDTWDFYLKVNEIVISSISSNAFTCISERERERE